MRRFKKTKYKLDVKKISVKREEDLSGEEIYKEMLRSKKRKVRR